MILAIIGAGESSRLKSEGLKSSKHLIRINGEFLIERIIRIAVNNGVNKVICIINSKEPELKDYLLSSKFGVPLELIVKDTSSSMHSLFELAPHISNEPFCLATTDSVFLEKDFSDFIHFCFKQKDIEGVLALTDFIDDEKPLCASMDGNNRILEFSDSKDGYSWATGGVYYFSTSIFLEMDEALETGISRLRNYLRLLVNKGYIIKGFPFSKIIDVDHVSDIKKAEDFLNSVK